MVPRIKRLVGPISLTALFAAMASWSWRKWPDVLVDFGRELYIPWQLLSGKVLYEDIAHLFGPFSPYFNAAMFRLFGASYTALFSVNMVLLGLLLWLMYALIARACSRLSAFMLCSVMLLVFAFSQYLSVGNYNYISPYAHEAVHGVLLGFIMIALLARYERTGRRSTFFGVAVSLGCILLTKPEIFLAALVTCTFYFLFVCGQTSGMGTRIGSLARLLALALLPTFGFLIYFSSSLSATKALGGMFGAWAMIANKRITTSTFYTLGSGMDAPWANAAVMVLSAVAFLSVVLLALLLAHTFEKQVHRPIRRSLCVLGLAMLCAASFWVDPYLLGRPLPILAAASLILLWVDSRRIASATDVESAGNQLSLLLWACFAVCLLPKILLHCRLHHYGFSLAMPAALLISVMLTHILPTWLDRYASGGRLFAYTMTTMLILLSMRLVNVSDSFYDMKSFEVGEQADAIKTYEGQLDPRGPLTAKAVQWLAVHSDPDDTLLVLPEGAMINYLARRSNSTRHVNLMPPELFRFSEEAILEDIKDRPPDYIALAHKSTAEYGLGLFGKDPEYGKRIMEWIVETYEPVALFGDEPLQNHHFGIKILSHKAVPEEQAP